MSAGVSMIHYHPTVRKEFSKTHCCNIEFFCFIKLILVNLLYYNVVYDDIIEQYVEIQTSKGKQKQVRYIEMHKVNGNEYWTERILEELIIVVV